ncbi:MAG: RNA pseudouridine synthase [Oceanospirillaceae bacterium]|nr:RNA pseudouridine synthase [Oceanospirillaceae bacterium]MCP5350652.1 RNA pseudouridine synthase [Oceanospirillaceae bacterium]
MSDIFQLKTRVLYQDDAILIINKPAGIAVQDDNHGAGLFNRVKEVFNLPDACPVHRLDQGTSGIYIVAKNSASAAYLGRMFEQHQVQKYYLALSMDKPKRKQGWVIGDMVPGRNGNQKLLTSRENPAVTYFFSKSLRPGVRAFALKLFTGKTHQARVALKSNATPIAGDKRYAGKTAERLYLHAAALQLPLPNGQLLNLHCWPMSSDGAEWADIDVLFGHSLLDLAWPVQNMPN